MCRTRYGNLLLLSPNVGTLGLIGGELPALFASVLFPNLLPRGITFCLAGILQYLSAALLSSLPLLILFPMVLSAGRFTKGFAHLYRSLFS